MLLYLQAFLFNVFLLAWFVSYWRFTSFQMCHNKHVIFLLHKILDRLALVTAVRINFYTNVDGQERKVTEMFLRDDKNLPLAIKPVDAKGNAAPIDGVPAWSVTDESLATLEVAADGLSAVLKPVGPLGVFKVQCHADADLGPDAKDILGELDMEIIGGEAVSLQLSAGEPVDA